MKKFGLGVIGLLLVGAIYYFTAGESQLANNMKAQVNKELASIQTHGFTVEDRDISEKKEHFVLSFDEPKKITAFFTQKGAQLNIDDAEAIKGLKIGVDVSYLANTYSAVSFDIYPISLPTSFEQADKKIVKQLTAMLDKKTFLMHVDVNKLGNGFKGSVKDIDETIYDDEAITLTSTAFTFSGDLQDDKLKSVQQSLENVTIAADDELKVTFENLKSNYALTGATNYDYTTNYNIESINIDAKKELQVHLNNITMSSDSTVKNNLAETSVHSKVKYMEFSKDSKITTLSNLLFDMKASNLDISAFAKLEKIDPDDTKAMTAIFQQLISQGVVLDIPNFSVEKLVIENQKIDGFTLSSTLEIDKSLQLSALEKSPLLAINAINANIDLSLSDSLFAFVATQPQAVMAMMMIQPKSVNGQKVYKVELTDGKLTVNDKPIM